MCREWAIPTYVKRLSDIATVEYRNGEELGRSEQWRFALIVVIN